ncbi:MAG TPA: F0F1 ATP synthase subunit A [Candidatus Saccharimonadales bacterium]|nr:F0F1 ATP synthase subunit A [Candidatus Saccharimonadales bacterium]
MMNIFAAEGPHISIAPDTLFHIGPMPVTNSQILGIVGSLLVLWILWATAKAIKNGSRARGPHMILWFFENLYDTTVEVIGDKHIARKVIPLAVTIVFFFVINNWLGLLPIVGSITYNDVPLLRGAAADLNMTFAVAIISIVTAQIWAAKRRGFFGNIGRYINFHSPLHFAEGILDLIAEFSRTAALSLRMFGNVFGGEVLLVVIAFLTSYAAAVALPVFYVLELFVGAVQAYVFYMLTIAFISLGLPNPDEAHGHSAEAKTEIGAPAQEKA